MSDTIRSRLAALRDRMRLHGIDAYRIGTADDHASEYVAPHFQTRAWFSGFTGSAGTLLVTTDSADLWTDGRYFLQAESQLAGSAIRLRRQGEEGTPTIARYLAETLPDGAVIGTDGKTTSVGELQALRDALAEKNFRFDVQHDLAQVLWRDRPPMPQSTLFSIYSGELRSEKLVRIRAAMDSGADSLLISSLEEIAWTLNLRGHDVRYTPVFYAYLLIGRRDAVLFTDSIIPEDIRLSLAQDGVRVLPYADVAGYCRTLSAPLVCDRSVNAALYSALPRSTVLCSHTPIRRMKAIKNETEQQNERIAHLWDGLAVTRLIFRLKTDGKQRTECSLCRELEELRKLAPSYEMPSFGTIAAFGEHGAVIHYEPDEKSDAPLTEGLLLLDTGGQYEEGTTDLTRTVVLGTATDRQKRHYTAVLRGNLAVSAASFGVDEGGSGLDALARAPIRAEGLDYAHGTGHGVGYRLAVHESPPGLRKTDGAALEAGMIVSDEPGIYLEGQYGIRLENLLLCRNSGDRRTFEILSLVPFDRDAIEPSLMTRDELRTLNAYHETVFKALSPYLEDDVKAWLKAATAPIF